MNQITPSLDFKAKNSSNVLRRLIALRAFVLASFVFYVLVFDVSLAAKLYVGAAVLASAVFSLISWRLLSRSRLYSVSSELLQLLWDSAIIMAFVWLAGRSTNPFIYYQLLVIAVSASILPEVFAWLFAAFGVVAYTLLLYVDLGVHISHMEDAFRSHLMGMWINFSGSALLIAFFISRLSLALRKQDEDLRIARESNLKNEQLIGIGTLAASTVHSFGTPLSTITMAVSELDALHPDQASRECTSMIRAQIARCKSTMKKLTSMTEREALFQQEMRIAELRLEIEEYLQLVNAQPMPVINMSQEIENDVIPGGILLLHAVINLIDNAVRAARDHVAISISSGGSPRSVRILIEDDGNGLEQNFTDQASRSVQVNEKGMGIGLMLVNSTIERLGGSVVYKDKAGQQPMTQITVVLPLMKA